MENNQLQIGCVVMAAGNARRFGENKLATLFEGRPLVEWAMEAVPREAVCAVAVVTQYPEVAALARGYGFRPVRNHHPDWGISHTIRLGLDALGPCDGALFQVSDQPLLRREAVEELIDLYRRHPDCVAALGHNGVRGNPCLFPARLFPELRSLTEDLGGSSVIRRHRGELRLVEVPACQLQDVDTPQALWALGTGRRLV